MSSDIFGMGDFKAIDSRSLMAFPIYPHFNDEQLGVATAFLYECDKGTFLVTNWHNVTGRRPDTHQPISSSGGIPNRLRVEAHSAYNQGNGIIHHGTSTSWLPLYWDDEMFKPTWLEHPVFGDRVDVVAIKLGDKTNPFPSDACRLNRGDPLMRVSIGTDAFILGFPRGISGGRFPIWKRGSFASEPYHDIDGLPKCYVDTATREGMSGAPVIAASNGVLHIENLGISGRSNGIVHRFVGVYSGRIGVGTSEAQLAVVWKESALYEIICGGDFGKPSCLLTPKSSTSTSTSSGSSPESVPTN